MFAEYQVVEMLLAIIYVLLMAVFVFVILYPFVREFCHEFFTSKTAGEVAAISSTLMMLGYGFWMLYYFVEAFIGLLLILASLFSGLTLLYRARESSFLVGHLDVHAETSYIERAVRLALIISAVSPFFCGELWS